MQTADLRIDAGWIVPIEPEGALRDHALVISAGRIAALLPIAEADQSIEARVQANFAPREPCTTPSESIEAPSKAKFAHWVPKSAASEL